MARLPHTNIAVDYWRLDPGVSLRFLTHCHADHTKGLTPRWNYGTIYCSAISAKILKHRFGIDPAIIRELEINSTSLIFLDEARTESMTVTVLDANHCPGSVMFLFQGYFGTILHTGDFRWAHGVIDVSPLDGLSVDMLYLDNTYLDARQAQFPSREEAYLLMREVVTSHMDHIIYVGVDSIGKEELLIQLGRDLGVKVAVTEERYRELMLMGLADECFTTDDAAALIRVMPKERITMEFLREANVSKPTIGILPTGWREKWASKLRAGRLYHVPYSLHSSYAEILDFVAVVRPRSVRPIVLDHGDVSVLTPLLDPSPPAPVRMPDALRNPALARLAPITPIQRVPPAAARAGTLTVVKADIDEEEEAELAKKRLLLRPPPRLTPPPSAAAAADPLDLLAEAVETSEGDAHLRRVVKAEDRDALPGDDADQPPVLLRAHSDPSPNDVGTGKQFRKQNVVSAHKAPIAGPKEAHAALPPAVLVARAKAVERELAAEFEATPPPPPPPASDDARPQARRSPSPDLDPDHAPPPPPLAGAASRKRRYAHPLAANAAAARAVLARVALTARSLTQTTLTVHAQPDDDNVYN